MNKKINENQLETMLSNYCTRKRQIAFDVSFEQEKEGKRHIGFFSVVASVLVVAVVFGFVLFQPVNTENSPGKVPNGFSISVSAAQREPVMLENVEVELCSKEEKGIFADIVFEDGMISLEPICFNMNGENIETFDYKCENGLLYYIIPELKEQMQTQNDGTITQNDYFQKGKSLENIPYNSDKPSYIFVSWYSYRLDEEASAFFDMDIAEISDENFRTYRKEHLKTNDDFNYYFGDTITVTAHYKDGQSETAVIDVTVETREEDGKTYGNYVLKYK